MVGARLVVALGIAASACRASTPEISVEAPRWEDDDRHPFEPAPEPFYSPFIWDGADNSFFRPLAEFWRFEAPREAINVNAVDEVPDSSWFTHRIGRWPARERADWTPEHVARGACTAGSEPVPPWTATSGKPDGANPGFFISDARGQRYLMKTDGLLQPERPSAADAIASAIYHAAGYFVPCNQVVYFDPSIIQMAPDAKVELTSGQVKPMTEDHVQQVLAKATPGPDGTLRALVSRFIDARPISPWRYEGTRSDDPNDVVPHEHRRELRGMYLLAAWVDHIDSRQENTLAAWVSTDNGGYVRHYVIDFGDCFGQLTMWRPLSARLGHSGYADFEHIAEDFVTLGLLDRPWFRAEYGPAGKTLGFYDASRFDADQWRPGYPNAAFLRLTERDAAWMARIIARFERPHVEALVERARFSEAIVQSELVRIMMERRQAILERYLTRLSPLTSPEVETGPRRLCLEDLAVQTGLRSAAARRYDASVSRDDEAFVEASPTAEGARVCVPLPGGGRVRVEWVARSAGREPSGRLRVELRPLDGALSVVRLERFEPQAEHR